MLFFLFKSRLRLFILLWRNHGPCFRHSLYSTIVSDKGLQGNRVNSSTFTNLFPFIYWSSVSFLNHWHLLHQTELPLRTKKWTKRVECDMKRIATCGFFGKGPEGSHENARLTKLRKKAWKRKRTYQVFSQCSLTYLFHRSLWRIQKNFSANRDLSTNLDIWILLFSSFSLTIAEFNENGGCFFMCLFLRLLQRYEEKPPPDQFFQSTVLILGHFLFFPVNSLINSLFSRENKIALLYTAVTTQKVSWACVPIHFSHISAQVKLHLVV